jgi:hypothetical protein
MTLSTPSFFAAATSPFIPPKADAEVAVDAFVELLLLPPLLLDELDEPLLQPAANTTPLATAASAAIALLPRTVTLPCHPGHPGTNQRNLG